jgi:hypothetical protein
MATINKAWHSKHVLGQNAPLAKRIAWHLEHQKHCRCRPMPESIKAEIKKRNAAR